MLGDTHAIAGFTAGIGLAVAAAPTWPAAAIIIGESWLGSMLPDIDHKNSKISKKLKPAGFIARLFAGHRTLFHNPFFYGTVYAALWYFRPDLAKFLIPLFMGVGTHLLLDALTPMGVPLLPHLKLHLANIHTGSRSEYAFRGLFIFVVPFVALLAAGHRGLL